MSEHALAYRLGNLDLEHLCEEAQRLVAALSEDEVAVLKRYFVVFRSDEVGTWILGAAHPQLTRAFFRRLLLAANCRTLGFHAGLDPDEEENPLTYSSSEAESGIYHDPSAGLRHDSESTDTLRTVLEVAGLLGMKPVERRGLFAAEVSAHSPVMKALDFAEQWGAPPKGDDVLVQRVAGDLIQRLIDVGMMTVGEEDRSELVEAVAARLLAAKRRPVERTLLEVFQSAPSVVSVKPRARWIKDYLEESVVAVRGFGAQSTTGWY